MKGKEKVEKKEIFQYHYVLFLGHTTFRSLVGQHYCKRMRSRGLISLWFFISGFQKL